MESTIEAGKARVLAFYDAVVNAKDFATAERYLGDRYVQHNPLVADGSEGLRGFIDLLRERFPQSRSEVLRAVAEGPFVVLHVRSTRTPGGPTRAILELFRLDGDRIVEHWDVIQQVPDTAANANGMF
jgi:predicted SnoaL-like aldol condensation-catalyzing enzyme